MRWHVYGRTEYARPLEHVTDVDVDGDGEPALDDLGVGDDWLELVVFPVDDVEWIIRDGTLVRELHVAGGVS